MQKSRKDVLNFDTEFTKEEPTLTPINVEVVRTINQDEFKGFSFYNTQFGKQVSLDLDTAQTELIIYFKKSAEIFSHCSH